MTYEPIDVMGVYELMIIALIVLGPIALLKYAKEKVSERIDEIEEQTRPK